MNKNIISKFNNTVCKYLLYLVKTKNFCNFSFYCKKHLMNTIFFQTNIVLHYALFSNNIWKEIETILLDFFLWLFILPIFSSIPYFMHYHLASIILFLSYNVINETVYFCSFFSYIYCFPQRSMTSA